MIVTYLDLETGRKSTQEGISRFSLEHGNWSCDCNRRIAFDGIPLPADDYCEGSRRFIAIGLESEPMDEPFDETEVLQEANKAYWINMQNAELSG